MQLLLLLQLDTASRVTFKTSLKCLFVELYDHEVYWEITIDRKQDWDVRVGGQLRLRQQQAIYQVGSVTGRREDKLRGWL